MIETIGGVWLANETKTFVINGEYIEILEAQYPIDVMLMDKAGAQLSIMRSSEASFYSRPKEGFQTVQITSAQAQTVRVFIGSGDAGTRRIASTVAVIDGGRARTLANAAFMKAGGQSAVAGQYSRGSLWNPVGSPVRAVIKQFAVTLNAAGPVNVGPLVAADGTIKQAPASKLSAGAASVNVQAYANTSAAVVGTSLWDFFQFGGAGTIVRTLAEPIILQPGSGIYFENAQQNNGVSYTCEFTEETI